jgi:hypothetical protein
MKLNEKMKKALMQIGFGVTYRRIPYTERAAFYDESDERVDLRSVLALHNRGLVYGFTSGGAPCVSNLRLTEKGEELFEELR